MHIAWYMQGDNDLNVHEVFSVPRVEAGHNTSTLRVVEGDEKGTQCLGV
jgi:hypothetical protein